MNQLACHRCKSAFPITGFPFKSHSTERSRYCRDCTKFMASQSRAAKKHGKGTDYVSRNEWLKELGFGSYRDYLASDLWKSIRVRVYAIKGRNCFMCGEPATELHHNRYYRNDLLGKRLKFINPICRECHESIEFSEGRKTTVSAAKRSFKRRRREHLSARGVGAR